MVVLQALNKPEKDFVKFRKNRLANPEESRETSDFSVKNFTKSFPACSEARANYHICRQRG